MSTTIDGQNGSIFIDGQVSGGGGGTDAGEFFNSANTNALYVDVTNGDDSTGDGTAQAPFETITRAFEQTLLMDETVISILLNPGTYDIEEAFVVDYADDITIHIEPNSPKAYVPNASNFGSAVKINFTDGGLTMTTPSSNSTLAITNCHLHFAKSGVGVAAFTGIDGGNYTKVLLSNCLVTTGSTTLSPGYNSVGNYFLIKGAHVTCENSILNVSNTGSTQYCFGVESGDSLYLDGVSMQNIVAGIYFDTCSIVSITNSEIKLATGGTGISANTDAVSADNTSRVYIHGSYIGYDESVDTNSPTGTAIKVGKATRVTMYDGTINMQLTYSSDLLQYSSTAISLLIGGKITLGSVTIGGSISNTSGTISFLKSSSFNYDIIVSNSTELMAAFASTTANAGKSILIMPGQYTVTTNTTCYLLTGMRIYFGTGGNIAGATSLPYEGCAIKMTMQSGSCFRTIDQLWNSPPAAGVAGVVDRTNSFTGANPQRLVLSASGAPAAATFPAAMMSGSSPMVAVGGDYLPVVTYDSTTQLTLSGNNFQTMVTSANCDINWTVFSDDVRGIQMFGSVYFDCDFISVSTKDSTPIFALTGYMHDTSGLTMKLGNLSRMYNTSGTDGTLINLRVINSVIGCIYTTGRNILVNPNVGATFVSFVYNLYASQASIFKGLYYQNENISNNDATSQQYILICCEARLTQGCDISVYINKVRVGISTGAARLDGIYYTKAVRTIFRGHISQFIGQTTTNFTMSTNAINCNTTLLLTN